MNKKERERAEEDDEEKNKPEEAEANSRLRGRHKRKRERDKLSGPPHHLIPDINVHLSFLRRGSHAFDLTHSCGSLSPFPVEELCLRISKLSRIRRFF